MSTTNDDDGKDDDVMAQGYRQILIAPEDTHETALVIPQVQGFHLA